MRGFFGDPVPDVELADSIDEDRSYFLTGLLKACEKRPVAMQALEDAVGRIERQCTENFDREVPSRYIGEKVITALQHLDQVAYVRFASVYRAFQDVNDFVEELQPMLRQSRKKKV